MAPAVQSSLPVEIIKQYSGDQAAQRRVKVKPPGRFFPQLQPNEQKEDYTVEAVEFKDQKFSLLWLRNSHELL